MSRRAQGGLPLLLRRRRAPAPLPAVSPRFASRPLAILSLLCVLPAGAAALEDMPAEELYGPPSPTHPVLSRPGDNPVGVRTLELRNPDPVDIGTTSRESERRITVEVWYPAAVDADAGRASYVNETRSETPFRIAGRAFRDAPARNSDDYPLVVLSHGYTGYRTLMFYLGEHLASHGYVVAAPDHPLSTNASVDSHNARRAGFPSTLFHRARDQQFILEWFAREQGVPAVITDTAKATIIGYSMGGYGAINTVGGCYRFTRGMLEQMNISPDLLESFNSCNAGRPETDPRWAAMVGISSWGQVQRVHDVDALAAITVPALFIVGDQDHLSGYSPGVKDLFDGMRASQRYMLVYENARHNVAPHPAPTAAYDTLDSVGHYLESNWDTRHLNRINQHMILAFLDCVIKDRDKACRYLPRRIHARQGRLENGEKEQPWPGFADGWATGMRFYRADTERKPADAARD